MNNEQQSYNGWANHATWCVGLWLSNDEVTYTGVRALVKGAKDRYDASQAVKAYVEGCNPLAQDASLFGDLLNAALAEVDWQEVAESILDE